MGLGTQNRDQLWRRHGCLIFLSTMFLISQNSGIGVDATCPNATAFLNTGDDMKVTVISEELVAVTCIGAATTSMMTSGSMFPAWRKLNLVELSSCHQGQWTPIQNECIEAQIPEELCSAVDPPVVANTTLGEPQILGGAPNDLKETGKVYKCIEGYTFLSGEPAQVSSCSSGLWTSVYDVCEEACKMPQDCTEVLNATYAVGTYIISPTGRIQDNVAVHCETFHTSAGWTKVSYHNTTNDNLYTDDKFRFGFGQSSSPDMNFFIGMDYLAAIGQDHELEETRPLTVMLVIEDDMNMVHHATYSDVIFTPHSDIIHLNGNFYGDAGNCWGNGSISIHPNNRSGNCDILKTIGWDPMMNVVKIEMFVRPQSYDTSMSCPVIELDAMGYPEMIQLFLPMTRSPMQSITYVCPQQYLEQTSGNQMGVIGCMMTNDMTSSSGGTLAWNDTILLPCLLHCPDPFVKNLEETHCFHFLPDPEPFGVHSAALSCNDLNAGLAVIGNPEDLTLFPEASHHYTSHVAFPNYTLAMDPTSFIDCNVDENTCSVTAIETCLTASQVSYKLSNCLDESMTAACMLPADCPANYVPYRGLCYRAYCSEIESMTLEAILTLCSNDEAALAYPESKDVLEFIYHLASVENAFMPVEHVAIGLNDASGDWTNGGLYAPDENILSIVGEYSTYGMYWRKLAFNRMEGPTLKGRPMLAPQMGGCAVCQYLARIDCWTDAPAVMGNMTSNWDGHTNALGTMVKYSCYPGHFFQMNISFAIFTTKCYGQLRNWYPSPTDCEPVNVCLEELPVPPATDAIINQPEGFRFLNGSVSFTCPEGMSTAKGIIVQNVTCQGNMGVYSFQPAVLEPCHVVCPHEPIIDNGHTDWNATSIYIDGTNVTATCNPGYQVSLEETIQTVNCTNATWISYFCFKVCEADPPVPGENMVAPMHDSNYVGTVYKYNCSELHYTIINETYPVPKNHTLVECNNSSVWIASEPLSCAIMCLDNPPSGSSPFTSNWDGFSRILDTQVDLACGENYLLGDLSETASTFCGSDGLWTALASNISTCIQGSYSLPSSTAPESIGATLEPDSPAPFLEGDTATFTCEEGKLAPMGVPNFTVTFTNGAWTEVDESFICYDLHDNLPNATIPEGDTEAVLGTFHHADPPFFVGIVANYTCPPEFGTSTGLTFYEITNTPDGWEPLPETFICYKGTYLPPVIPSFAIEGGSLVNATAPFYVGQSLTYSCFPNYLTNKTDVSGDMVTSTSLTYTGNDVWTEFDQEVECVWGKLSLN